MAKLHKAPGMGKVIDWFSSVKKGTKIIGRILHYTNFRERLLIAASFIASVACGATLPLMNIIFGRMVKEFSTPHVVYSWAELSSIFMGTINKYTLYVVYLFAARFVLAYIAIIGFRCSSMRISAGMRSHYLRSLIRQPISTLDAIPPGQTTTIITISANILQIGISERLSSLVQAVSLMIISLIIGCLFNWQLTLVTASGLLAIVLWYAIITPQIVRKYAKVQVAERDIAGLTKESLANIRMIVACDAENKVIKHYNTLVDKASKLARSMSLLMAIQHSPVFFSIYATFALCFWFAGRLYLRFAFKDVETLIVVLMSVMLMISNVHAISIPLTAFSQALHSATLFFTIIDGKLPDTSGTDEIDYDSDIVLEKVNFAYPSRHDVKVLNQLSLRIPPGKVTAIVGPSGHGKSTVLALIQRWYELGGTDEVTNYLRNGSIKIGGTNLKDIDLAVWRSKIGVVQQEPFLFNETIFKNVAAGLSGTEWEHAEEDVVKEMVEQACKEAYADAFITRLPKGYDTSVGDGGLQLSGGERQRIAIARAIIRQPKILLFDEATSALDVNSERIVQAALKQVAQSRTTIVIAHRLSTIKDADNIAVVLKGAVIEQGTHEGLLKDEGGAYWNLVNAQQLEFGLAHTKMAHDHLEDITCSSVSDGRTSCDITDVASVLAEKVEARANSIEELMSDAQRADIEETTGTSSSMKKKVKSISLWRSFMSLLLEQKCNWVAYGFMALAAIGAASTYPIQAYLFACLISSFSLWGIWFELSISFLCVMLLAVAVGIGICYFALGWLSNIVAVRTISTYRRSYYTSHIRQPISFFDHPENALGLLVTRIATDPAQLQQLLGLNMAMVIISIFNVIGCLIISILFSWKFAVVVAASSMPIILVCGWYRVRYEVKYEARNTDVFAKSARYATEAIGAIRTVASLTLEHTVCEKYDGLLEDHVKKSTTEAFTQGVVFAASDSVVLLCMAFALWYGGKLESEYKITSFAFLLVYMAIIQGSLAAGQWLSFGPNMAQVSAAATRIRDMRDSVPAVIPDPDEEDSSTAQGSSASSQRSGRQSQDQIREEEEQDIAAEAGDTEKSMPLTTIPRAPSPLKPSGAKIELRDVHFSYPTRSTPVLRGLSLIIQPGQFVGIVGGSGAGKTTVISMLQQFYQPTHGAVLFDDVDTSTVPATKLRKKMSLVAQEPYLFSGTIRNNVLLGMPKEVDNDDLHTACKNAGIHEFISSLPDGYSTYIGPSGVALSGGQRSRLAIARALIRNPSILLLDEATSSLDSETEKEVQAVFEKTGKGRTMVAVAHRLSTVQNADVIFVMDRGRVVEFGGHRELVRRRGWYWKMCQAQALGA